MEGEPASLVTVGLITSLAKWMSSVEEVGLNPPHGHVRWQRRMAQILNLMVSTELLRDEVPAQPPYAVHSSSRPGR